MRETGQSRFCLDQIKCRAKFGPEPWRAVKLLHIFRSGDTFVYQTRAEAISSWFEHGRTTAFDPV